MNNLELYERYAQPPQDALKQFNNGRFSGTDINPMWRIKALTQEFGPCGIGWYTEINRMWREDSVDNVATVYCEVALYIKHESAWSKPIIGVGGNTLTSINSKNKIITTDEAYKMAYTDALGIACKALGIGANVWWESADSKYMRQDQERKEREAKQAEANANAQERNANAVPAKISKAATVGIDRNAAYTEVKQQLNCDDAAFVRMRQALIDGGAIANKPSKELTDDEYMQMLAAIVSNYAA